MLCKCGCGRAVATQTTGRPAAYFSGACRVRVHRKAGVTKVAEDVTKVALAPLSEAEVAWTGEQQELLSLGQSITYQQVFHGNGGYAFHIPAGLLGWTRFVQETPQECLPLVLASVRIYARLLIEAGLAKGLGTNKE
jgi:hypothetical protein